MMTDFQVHSRMSHEMFERCQICELMLNGSQMEEELKVMIEGHYERMAKDRVASPMPTCLLM